MNVTELRAFLTVAEELHFGRAAQRLNIAQPPLSRTIKRLELELGIRLFDRNTRSVKLTAGGQALIEPAREVFTALRRAEAAVRAAADGDVGLVRIAFAGVSTHQLIARVARGVRSRRPGIELELSSQNFAQPLVRRLLNGDTDIALGRWDVVPEALASRVVMPDALVIAVPDTHRLATRRSLSIAELSAAPFVALPPHEGSVISDRLRRLSHAADFVPEIVQIAPDTQTALALVGAEVGCHLTVASVADNVNDPHVTFLNLEESATDIDLRVAWRRTDPSPALHAVLEEFFTVDPAGARTGAGGT